MLDFLSTLPEESLVSEVNDELVINLEEPGKRDQIENDVLETDTTYLDYLSNTQQDDLLRKFILQERTAVPDPKCDDCSNISCKKCKVMKNHKSYSAYLAYQRMFEDMTLVEVDDHYKVMCSYNYREKVEEKL